MTQLLFAGTYDNLDNAWAVPTTVITGTGVGVAATTGCFFSGPNGCRIEDVYYVARDLTFTDPDANVYIGLQVRYSADGGVSHTTALKIWASADCPQIWDDTGADTQDFTLDVPVKAFAFYGAGAGGLTANTYGHLELPANVHVTVEVAPVAAEALIDMPATDLDTFDVYVYGTLY